MPVNREGLLICSRSIVPGELWVTVIEKAILKLKGGYDIESVTGVTIVVL